MVISFISNVELNFICCKPYIYRKYLSNENVSFYLYDFFQKLHKLIQLDKPCYYQIEGFDIFTVLRHWE